MNVRMRKKTENEKKFFKYLEPNVQIALVRIQRT